VCDYWFIRRPEGIYFFRHGFNWRAFVAWIAGFWSQLPGFAQNVTPYAVTVSKGWVNIFNLAFLVGFAISFTLFYTLNHIWPPKGVGEFDSHDVFRYFHSRRGGENGRDIWRRC
jgi:NCS1 family nucleobase:cation symporter-1